eukprot:NODE_140_length_17926_cov_0.139620.p10 type:complete len:212 gc:universal NODE_140_length_17926_cov_0.139620:13064-13699(+)
MNWTGGIKKRNNKPTILSSNNIIKSCEFKLPWAKRDQAQLKQTDSKFDQEFIITHKPKSINFIEKEESGVSEIVTQESRESSESSLKLNPPRHILELCGSPDIENNKIAKKKRETRTKSIHNAISKYNNIEEKSFLTNPLAKRNTANYSNDSLLNYLDTPEKLSPHSQNASLIDFKEDETESHGFEGYEELQTRVKILEDFLRSHFEDFKQ